MPDSRRAFPTLIDGPMADDPPHVRAAHALYEQYAAAVRTPAYAEGLFDGDWAPLAGVFEHPERRAVYTLRPVEGGAAFDEWVAVGGGSLGVVRQRRDGDDAPEPNILDFAVAYRRRAGVVKLFSIRYVDGPLTIRASLAGDRVRVLQCAPCRQHEESELAGPDSWQFIADRCLFVQDTAPKLNP